MNRKGWLARTTSLLLILFVSGVIIAPFTAPAPVHAATTYIFATFDGDATSEQELWIYTSTDGSNWSVYADTNFRGPTGVLRDPSIIKHTDGKYYVAYTNQHWSNTSTSFNIASSSDLINWSHVTTVNANLPGTQYTWAPEFFIDNGVVKVIVSLSPAKPFAFKAYVYTAQNSALTSWSGPVAMSGIGPNIIDTFVVKVGSTYHAFTQNGDTLYMEHATASSLTGPWTYIATGNWAGWGSGKEGPALFQLDDGTWTLFADWYSTNGIYKATSRDLINWSSPLVSVRSLSTKRHGTVLRDPSFGGGTGTHYTITARHSGKCLDVQNPNTSDGAYIGQWTCNDGAWQDWRLVDVGGGYYNIVSRHSGKCLDVNGASLDNGAQIIQWTCNGGSNQQWQWVAVGSYFQLRARHSGKCADVWAASTADGALVKQYTCGSQHNQQWIRTPQ